MSLVRISDSGYEQQLTRNGWEFTHRLIAEEVYGSIPEGYHVHHINGNKLDNRPENLKILSQEDHQKIHNIDQKDCASSENSSDESPICGFRENPDTGDSWFYIDDEPYMPENNFPD